MNSLKMRSTIEQLFYGILISYFIMFQGLARIAPSLMMHDNRTSVSPRPSLHKRPVFSFPEVSPRGRRSVRSHRCIAHDPVRGESRDQEGPPCSCSISAVIRCRAQVFALLMLLR